MQNLLNSMERNLVPYSGVLGNLMLIFGLGLSSIGFPYQVYRNYSDHACGISIIVIVLAIMLLLIRIPYSMSKRAWHMIPSDLIGLIATIALIWQWFVY